MELSYECCIELGMSYPSQVMPNGERRFRLMGPDNSGYIRVEMSEDIVGGWQNAHYHGGQLLDDGEEGIPGIIELSIVQHGQVGYAEERPDGTRIVRVFRQFEHWVMLPGIMHNVFMFPGAVTHTVKYGTPVSNPEKGADWYPATEAFDAWTKSLSVEDIMRLAVQST